jgi:hypothetical protein
VAASSEGQDHRAAGRFREARASFLKCSAATCNSVVRAGCVKWLSELEELQPSVIIRVTDARDRDVSDCHVSIDDAPIPMNGLPTNVDPGMHVLRATTDSGAVAEQTLLFKVGEKGRLIELHVAKSTPKDVVVEKDVAKDVAKTPASDSGRSVALPIGLASVGVLALGAFTYFEINGHSNYRSLERSCFATKTCTTEQIDNVKNQFVAAGVTVGIAAAAFVAAAIVYFASSGSSAAPPSTPSARASSDGLGLPF